MRRECFISGLHLVTHWAKVPVRVVWCLVPRGYWHVSGKLGKHLIAHKWTWWADVFVCSVTQSCPALCDSMKSNQAPLFIRLPSQEYQSGLPFPPPRDLPNPGTRPKSRALAGGFFTTEPPRKPMYETVSSLYCLIKFELVFCYLFLSTLNGQDSYWVDFSFLFCCHWA